MTSRTKKPRRLAPFLFPAAAGVATIAGWALMATPTDPPSIAPPPATLRTVTGLPAGAVSPALVAPAAPAAPRPVARTRSSR
ncbi:MAG: hypothetical protein U0556_07765 [Dehalococcoidia bacterium]